MEAKTWHSTQTRHVGPNKNDQKIKNPNQKPHFYEDEENEKETNNVLIRV